MRHIRRIIGDRLNGGLLAALLAYAFLFQSIGASIAGAQMAGMEGGSGALCITSAPGDHDHGNTDPWQCCGVLCQAACAFSASSAPGAGGAVLHPDARSFAGPQPEEWVGLRSPQQCGLRREARAPPHLSV